MKIVDNMILIVEKYKNPNPGLKALVDQDKLIGMLKEINTSVDLVIDKAYQYAYQSGYDEGYDEGYRNAENNDDNYNIYFPFFSPP